VSSLALIAACFAVAIAVAQWDGILLGLYAGIEWFTNF
jgi:hypothetical protein